MSMSDYEGLGQVAWWSCDCDRPMRQRLGAGLCVAAAAVQRLCVRCVTARYL